MEVGFGNGDIISRNPTGINGRGTSLQSGILRPAHWALRSTISCFHQGQGTRSLPRQR